VTQSEDASSTRLFASQEATAPDFEAGLHWANKAAQGGSADGRLRRLAQVEEGLPSRAEDDREREEEGEPGCLRAFESPHAAGRDRERPSASRSHFGIRATAGGRCRAPDRSAASARSNPTPSSCTLSVASSSVCWTDNRIRRADE